MPAKSLQSCLTLGGPMDHSLPGSSVRGALQTGILEGVAGPSSRGSSQPRDPTCVSVSPALSGRFFTTSATPPGNPSLHPDVSYSNCRKLKDKEIDESTIRVGDFSTPPSEPDRLSRQTTRKDMAELHSTKSQFQKGDPDNRRPRAGRMFHEWAPVCPLGKAASTAFWAHGPTLWGRFLLCCPWPYLSWALEVLHSLGLHQVTNPVPPPRLS